MKHSPLRNPHSASECLRREFFHQAGLSIGSLGLASMLGRDGEAATDPMAARETHYAPRAKAVIYMFMAGGPSQLELFEHKPTLTRLSGAPPPELNWMELSGVDTPLTTNSPEAPWAVPNVAVNPPESAAKSTLPKTGR